MATEAAITAPKSTFRKSLGAGDFCASELLVRTCWVASEMASDHRSSSDGGTALECSRIDLASERLPNNPLKYLLLQCLSPPPRAILHQPGRTQTLLRLPAAFLRTIRSTLRSESLLRNKMPHAGPARDPLSRLRKLASEVDPHLLLNEVRTADGSSGRSSRGCSSRSHSASWPEGYSSPPSSGHL